MYKSGPDGTTSNGWITSWRVGIMEGGGSRFQTSTSYVRFQFQYRFRCVVSLNFQYFVVREAHAFTLRYLHLPMQKSDPQNLRTSSKS